MTDEDIETLKQKERNCRDNAAAEMAVYDRFHDEYMRGISGHADASPETHKRSIELYDFVIRGRHRADGYIRDADLYARILENGR